MTTDYQLTAADMNILRDEARASSDPELSRQLVSAWAAGRDAQAHGFGRAPQYHAKAQLHWLAWLAGYDNFAITAAA